MGLVYYTVKVAKLWVSRPARIIFTRRLLHLVANFTLRSKFSLFLKSEQVNGGRISGENKKSCELVQYEPFEL